MTLRWVPGWNGLTEPEAVSYVAAVEAADGQELEIGVAKAINDFVLGCKNDGIWDAIKASCILAGARTLAGALVPLVGTAPTNVSGLFVAGDYNRETGLVGDGSTKYLNSNRNNNADPQNDNHNAAYVTSQAISPGFLMGATGSSCADVGSNSLGDSGFSRCRSSTGTNVDVVASTGFFGISRSAASSYIARAGSTNKTISVASNGVVNTNVLIYRRSCSGAPEYTDARIAFYSIGEALDLEKLDTRVTRLMNLITYTQTAGLPDLSTMDLDAAAYIGGAYRAGGTLS
jgi:hypothetical protein